MLKGLSEAGQYALFYVDFMVQLFALQKKHNTCNSWENARERDGGVKSSDTVCLSLITFPFYLCLFHIFRGLAEKKAKEKFKSVEILCFNKKKKAHRTSTVASG